MTKIFRAEHLRFIAAQCRSDFLGVLVVCVGSRIRKGWAGALCGHKVEQWGGPVGSQVRRGRSKSNT